VRDNGGSSFAEYDIALAELDRIEGKPHDGSIRRQTGPEAQATLSPRDHSEE
jgi:hypothetical protein